MKKELQKRRGIILAFLGFLCVISVKAQTWTAPVPVGSAITDGAQVYVYSVGAKAFLDRGGEWDTQAIVTPSTGSVITTVASSSLWILQFETSAKCLKHDVGSGWTFTDGNVNNTWTVQETDVVNHVYSLQVPSTFTPDYNVDQFLGTSATLYSSNNEGTVYDVRYNRTASDYTKWMFVTATDLATYNAKVQLDKYMTIAKLVGSSVDLTSYITTYNAGVTADINTAVTNLKAALTVTDKTSSINNPSFTSTATTGWSAANYGWNGTDQVLEYYRQNNKTLSQTVTGLPAGVYVVKAQGFQRPYATNTAARTAYTDGSDYQPAKLFVTASGTTSFIPLRSLFSETASPSGTTVDTYLFPSSQTTAKAAFDAGLYENELGYVTVDGTGSITFGLSVYYQGSKDGEWNVVDNFRLEYYGALVAPMLSTSTSSITFAGTKSSSFTVSSNQASDVTLTAPAGITLSTYTIPANPEPVSVDVTYDGNTTVADTIRLSCGALVAKIAVIANPTLTTSTSSIVFEGTTSSSFTVSSSQASDVTLTAPAGITLSTYSIPANPSAVSVNVTYDGTTALDDTIRLACGSLVAKVAVKSYSTACFTPLAPMGTNMIPDPYLNSLTGFGGWGHKATVTGDEVYCGMSCVKFTATTNGYPNGAALDVSNITWSANQTYRFRAMVNATDGSVAFLAKNADPDFLYVVPQSTGWVQIDQTFTTGATPTSGFFTFNNVDGSVTGKIAYIDNYELWPVSPTTAVKTTNELSKPSVYFIGNAIVADFELTQSSDVEISVFNAQGMLLNKTIGSFNAGKNSKAVNVNLTSGLYLVKLTQNGKSITTKVIR